MENENKEVTKEINNKDLKDEKIEEQKTETSENIDHENCDKKDDEGSLGECNCETIIKKLEEQLKNTEDSHKRTLAEFDNFRKRTAKEKMSMFDDGVKDTVEKILPIVDNIERALKAHKGGMDDPLYKGIEMTYKNLLEILEGMDVFPIDAIGQKFDLNLHSAVAHEDNDEYGENEIIYEMLKGYTYKDKVIRYSMVKVAN